MANRIGARQNANFLAVGIGPNITITPGPGAIGYPVFQDLSGSIGIVPTVRFNGDPVYVLDQSTQPRSDGDPGEGVGVKAKSQGVSGEVKPTNASRTVRAGGRPVVREGDDCTLNDGNCPGKYVIVPESSGAISASQPPQNTSPPAKPETPEEKGWWGAASPWVHGTLGVASFVPGISFVTGAADAAIYAAEGEMVEAGIAAASMIPGGKVVTTAGKAIKIAKTASTTAKVGKTAHAAEEAAKVARESEEAAKAAKEAARKAAKEKAEKEAAEDGTKVEGGRKRRRTGETGKCGEWLARADMLDQGFNEVVAVQNNSGHGVDLIGRNSTTGEVKVWEVKTTDTAQAPSLSREQKQRGGEKFTEDRLRRAAEGRGNYGKVPQAMENAEAAQDWIERAKLGNKPVSYEKREVFVDDLDKGCHKHSTRASRSMPW